MQIVMKLLLNDYFFEIMANFKVIKLNSVNVRLGNQEDESREYDIEVNVNVQNDTIISLDGGQVKKDDVVKATFHAHRDTQNMSWSNVTTDEKMSIQKAVDDFIATMTIEVPVISVNV